MDFKAKEADISLKIKEKKNLKNKISHNVKYAKRLKEKAGKILMKS